MLTNFSTRIRFNYCYWEAIVITWYRRCWSGGGEDQGGVCVMDVVTVVVIGGDEAIDEVIRVLTW